MRNYIFKHLYLEFFHQNEQLCFLYNFLNKIIIIIIIIIIIVIIYVVLHVGATLNHMGPISKLGAPNHSAAMVILIIKGLTYKKR